MSETITCVFDGHGDVECDEIAEIIAEGEPLCAGHFMSVYPGVTFREMAGDERFVDIGRR